MNKLVKWETFVYTVGIEGVDLKNKFLFQIFAAFRAAIELWQAADGHVATGLDASLSSFWTSRRCSQKRSPSRLPVSTMYSFLQKVQVMQ